MATKLASYHIPRAPGQNRSGWMMAVVLNGVVDFTGGKYGRHSILADNPKRVNAHWVGYVRHSRPTACPQRISITAWQAVMGDNA
jgi:hypothetical protein